jgi:hypothetical protein
MKQAHSFPYNVRQSVYRLQQAQFGDLLQAGATWLRRFSQPKKARYQFSSSRVAAVGSSSTIRTFSFGIAFAC